MLLAVVISTSVLFTGCGGEVAPSNAQTSDETDTTALSETTPTANPNQFSFEVYDYKTNELIMRNAQNTARQSVEIAKMASGSSVSISTLEKSFETIMKGIEDTKAIQEDNKVQRIENSAKLERIKSTMKKNTAKL